MFQACDAGLSVMKITMMLLVWLAFLGCDFALAMMSMQVRDVWSLSAQVWFPAGLLLGVLCVTPLRLWPVWLVSAALVHLVVSQLYDRPVNVSLIFCFFDLLLTIVTALAWQFFYGVMARPWRLGEMLVLILLCAAYGLVERVVTTWALYLLDYPIDRTLSLISIIGTALSYLPLTFLVIYLVTSVKQPLPSLRDYLLALVLLLLLLALFFSPPQAADSPISWRGIALMFSFAAPMLLAMRGDLLLLSGFLTLCTLGITGATLFGFGPFYSMQRSLQQGVLIAAWYCTALGIPAMLFGSVISQRYAAQARRHLREQLMNSVLQQGLYQRFYLDSSEKLRWRYQNRWQDSRHAPTYWQQFMGWLHPQDRSAVEHLKASASATPQLLPVRIADSHGQFHQTTLVLMACRQGQRCYFEGVIFPEQALDSLEKQP